MNLFIKGEYGRVMTITPEELKEKLGITFDIVALGIEVNDGETTIKAQSYPKWDYSNGNPPIDICVAAKSDEMQVGSLMMPTLNVPAPFICLYDEQGEDETEWYAGASLAPRKEGDESPHVVFVDSNYGKVAPETDIFENGSEIGFTPDEGTSQEDLCMALETTKNAYTAADLGWIYRTLFGKWFKEDMPNATLDKWKEHHNYV